ncbi:restriction endonuclease subunit S [Shewanella morhuae]|uniref:restriction endonuclease subunit S n=1 Tax=Shewanella morhuae TaxID=365591 RepID=UPI001BB9AFBE|nr:restriction endonuclease subunit S [Shewanella morhuae]GIU13946.1 type I restriction endonuclease subunit S [Shewanella morhuae]
MIGRYKAYPEYKESGVVWLGEIPVDWNVIPLKYLAALTPKKSGINKKKKSEHCSFIPMEKLKLNSLKLDETKLISEVYDGYTYFENEDVLIAKVTPCFENKNMAVAKNLINGIGFGSSEIYVLRTNSKLNNQFLFYRLQEDSFMEIATAAMSGAGGLKRVPAEVINTFLAAFPSYEEQQKIVNFLDHETAKIDTLIAKQEKLIELLKEKRQAVISHAVTKGLNPNAPMKYSGVEWLGEVPEHWDLKRFKHLFKIRKRIAGKTGFDILSITQKGIKVKDITSGEGQLSMDYSKYQLVYQGDYAMNHMDLLTGFVDISNYDGVTSPDYRVFTLEHKMSESSYYLRLLQMGYLDKLFYPLGQGAAHIGRWRLPTEAFNEFLAPCPPYEEQKEISHFVNKTHNQIDALLGKAESAINLMKERKTALISATVTGKIDVRNWRPQSEDLSED